MAKPIVVEQATFEAEVIQANSPVLVDFYADWCGPCRAVAPVVEELAAELDGKLKVAKLDVDQNQEISLQFGVQSIPTLILFQNGEEKERIVGFLPKPQLLSQIEPYIAAQASA